MSVHRIRPIRLGRAKRLTRSCLWGVVAEPLNPTLYFITA